MSGGEGAARAAGGRPGVEAAAGRESGPRERPEVLSNLPRRRPGRRSPRRDEATRPRARQGAREPRRAGGAPAPKSGSGAIEELVRTGVSVATGSVAVGARLAGRALGAVRGVVERR